MCKGELSYLQRLSLLVGLYTHYTMKQAKLSPVGLSLGAEVADPKVAPGYVYIGREGKCSNININDQ